MKKENNIEIELDELGNIVTIRGQCKAKDWPEQKEKLKEVFNNEQ